MGGQTTWRSMDDPANVENRNAGNGGDLVKHTVYLATVQFLLAQPPWRNGLLLRECHAGRGIYRIPPSDPRCRLLSCLCASPDGTVALLCAQRTILEALGCWGRVVDGFHWYAGSALMNAFALANRFRMNSLDLYEWAPETRRILRDVLTAGGADLHVKINISGSESDDVFDGEVYIASQIGGWGKQDLVLLDPFAMWRQPQDQYKRDRYGAIIDGLIGRGSNAPSLILFWTWGRAFPIAEGDLDGSIEPARNGYQDLRGKLHEAGLHFILIKWRWGLQFAMWVIVPHEHLDGLRGTIEADCRALSDYLLRHGRGQSLGHPRVDVSID